jgi:hypothetical protein
LLVLLMLENLSVGTGPRMSDYDDRRCCANLERASIYC